MKKRILILSTLILASFSFPAFAMEKLEPKIDDKVVDDNNATPSTVNKIQKNKKKLEKKKKKLKNNKSSEKKMSYDDLCNLIDNYNGYDEKKEPLQKEPLQKEPLQKEPLNEKIQQKRYLEDILNNLNGIEKKLRNVDDVLEILKIKIKEFLRDKNKSKTGNEIISKFAKLNSDSAESYKELENLSNEFVNILKNSKVNNRSEEFIQCKQSILNKITYFFEIIKRHKNEIDNIKAKLKFLNNLF